jgi:hypothetical protein
MLQACSWIHVCRLWRCQLQVSCTCNWLAHSWLHVWMPGSCQQQMLYSWVQVLSGQVLHMPSDNHVGVCFAIIMQQASSWLPVRRLGRCSWAVPTFCGGLAHGKLWLPRCSQLERVGGCVGAVVAEAAAFSKEAVRRLRKVSVSVCRMYGRVVMTNPFTFF